MKFLIVFTSLFGLLYGKDDIIQIDQGLLKGSTLKTRNGRDFVAFQGIPYAKPPINELRFEVKSYTLIFLLFFLRG